jgi:YVTN family beta-propeller protein
LKSGFCLLACAVSLGLSGCDDSGGIDENSELLRSSAFVRTAGLSGGGESALDPDGGGPRNPGPGTGNPVPFPGGGGGGGGVGNPGVFITNSSSGTVDVYDPDTYSFVSSIPAGSAPQGLSYDADNGRILVANSGGTIPIIDVTSLTVTATITVGSPFDVVYDPGTDAIFSPNRFGGGGVQAFAGQAPFAERADSPGAILQAGEVEIDTLRGDLYVSRNQGGASALFAFNAADLSQPPVVVNTGDDAADFADALHFDGQDRIYVGNDGVSGIDSIKVIDADTLAIIDSADAGTRVVSITSNPDLGQVYSVGGGSDTLHVFEATGMGIAEVAGSPLTTGLEPISVTYDSQRQRILVVSRLDNSLHVYNSLTLAPVPGSPFPLQGQPQGVIVVTSMGP